MKLRYASSLAFGLCLITASSFAQTGGVVLRSNSPMGAVLSTGDNVSFEYQTREDAAVVVFNIDSQGLVHVLHPQGEAELSEGLQSYTIPSDGSSSIVVDSPTGVEFVFALAVKDPSAINVAALDRLREIDSGGEPYRVEGDPFLAANQIANDLTAGVSNRDLYFGYTYFYVNDRVDYPCYLCAACDGVPDDPSCEQNRVVQSFDRRPTLTYPLSRAYEIVTEDSTEISAEEGTHIDVPEGSDVDVNFYPYGVEARAVDPFYSSLWNDWWYDPFYWYGPYYPYYSPYWGPGWNISIGLGWGWGWGWWGGYYCSGWYAPCGWYSPYCGYNDGYYGGGSYGQPDKFKAKYKTASALTTTHAVAAKRDGNLRIASKDVQSWKQVSKGVSRTTSSAYASGRGKSKGAFDSYQGGSRVIKSTPYKSKGFSSSRSGSSSTRLKGTTTRGMSSSRKGVSNIQRGGGYNKSKSYAPGYGGSKSRSSGSYAPRSSGSRSKGSSYAPRSGSSYRGSAMKGSSSYRGGSSMRSAPSYRGGGGGSMRSAPSFHGGGGGRSYGGGGGGRGGRGK